MRGFLSSSPNVTQGLKRTRRSKKRPDGKLFTSLEKGMYSLAWSFDTDRSVKKSIVNDSFEFKLCNASTVSSIRRLPHNT